MSAGSVSSSPPAHDETVAGSQANAADPPDKAELDAGARVGRYQVEAKIGAGGMGVVYRARDPDLERDVALKVLRRRGSSARLLREAQALASLNHPNVIGIHDVGEHEDRVWIAMELVDGETLGRWVTRNRPSWKVTLELLCLAAEGLAAAHERALVHRDFKPDNVMVSADGRVRVLDFGLARFESTSDESSLNQASEPQPRNPDTRPFVGTPGYMAPEQLWHRPADARSDQFAFCVTAWEMLFGRRPFEGKTLPALVDSVTAGRIGGAPGESDVPQWVRNIVERGLAVEPAQRWPSILALLAALRHRATRRRRWTRAGVAVCGVAASLLAIVVILREPEPCDGSAERLAGAWDDARRTEVDQRIRALEAPYAGDVARDVVGRLESYSQEWIAMHTEACAATNIRQEQSAAVLDLRMTCLARARSDLRATVDVLAHPDRAVAERATELLDGLAPLHRCADIGALEARIAQPPIAARALVNEAEDRIAEAKALTRAGRYASALSIIDEVASSSVVDRYPPLAPAVATARGSTLLHLGRTEAARVAYEHAVHSGVSEGKDSEAATAAIALVAVLSGPMAQPEAALARVPQARALTERAGEPRVRARFHMAVAAILWRQGKFRESQAEAEAALAIAESAGLELTGTRAKGSIASAMQAQGRRHEAFALRQEVLETEQAMHGRAHPLVAAAEDAVADSLTSLGRYDEAEAHHQNALRIRIGATGDRHPDVAKTLSSLGLLLSHQGKDGEAEQQLRRALAIQLDSQGPRHADVATVRNNLSLVLRQRNRLAEAEAELREVVAIREETLDADHPVLATTRANLALMLRDQGAHEEAEALLRRAADSLSATLGEDSLDVARTMKLLGETLLAQGKHADAATTLEFAWRRLAQDDVVATTRGMAAFSLAKALSRIDRESSRPAILAATARDAIAEYGEQYAETLAEIDAWIDAHPAPG